MYTNQDNRVLVHVHIANHSMAFGQKNDALVMWFSLASASPPLFNPITKEQLYNLQTHAHDNYSIF